VTQRPELGAEHFLEGSRPREVGEPSDQVLLDGGVLGEDLSDQGVVREDNVVLCEHGGVVEEAGEGAGAAARRGPAAAFPGFQRLDTLGERTFFFFFGKDLFSVCKDPLLDSSDQPQRGGEVGIEQRSRRGGEVLLLL